MEDDVPADVKQRRLAEIIALQGELSRKRMQGISGKWLQRNYASWAKRGLLSLVWRWS